MFTAYGGQGKPISQIVSEKVSSRTAAQLNCALIHQILGPKREEKRVTHLTCGKLLKGPKDVSGLTIIGKQVTRLLVPISPRTHRIQKLKLQSIEKKLFEKSGDERIHTPPEGFERLHEVVEKNEYPCWNGFLEGLEARAKKENNNELLMEEIEKLFAVWNSDFGASFSETGESEYLKKKHIVFDGWPPWRHSEFYTFGKKIEVFHRRNVIHLAVTKNFYAYFDQKLKFNWEKCASTPDGISLSSLELEIDLFIRDAVKITRTDWPLEICEILLKNSNYWVSCISESTASNEFFQSIAGLQTTLLRKVILNNVEASVNVIYQISQIKRLKIVLSDDEINIHALWSLICRFEELGQQVLRVEHRLLPDVFPKKKYLVIEKMIPDNNHPLLLQIQSPFLTILMDLSEVNDKTIAIINDKDTTSDRLLEMHDKITNLQKNVEQICPRIFTDLFEFDFSPCIENIFEKLDMLRNILKQRVNEFISEQAKIVIDYYNLSSKKLYGQTPLIQLHNLVEVQGQDIQTLKLMVKQANVACSPLLDVFDVNELTFLRYYQAARVEKRLAYLAKLIWDCLQVDRDAIEKSVIERSTTVFYECEMLERKVKQSIKRYKLYQKSTIHVRMLAKRFGEMATTLEKLANEAPILNNQLGLLGLESLTIDVVALAEQCRLFANVTDLHAEITACEELYMNTKVKEVDYAQISVQFNNLSKRFTTVDSFVLTDTNDVLVKDTLTQLIATIENAVKTFNETLPLIKSLRAEGMKERHWENVLNKANGIDQMHDQLLIKDLIALDLNEKVIKCEEVSVIASKELQLETNIDKIKQFWDHAEISFKMDRKDYELEIPIDISCVLDEHIIQVSMTLASPFAVNIASNFKELLKKLQTLQRIFGLYQTCHTKIVHLGPLFSAEDIAYQMPEEWRIYQAAISFWHSLINQLKSTPKYFTMLELDFEQKFNEIFDMFKTLQVGFDAYLQQKKLYSPRLHFLSNNELLEMLSKACTPTLLEPFLPKLFTSIAILQFNSNNEIVTVYSIDGEKLDFHRPVNINLARRRIEKWLVELEHEMKHTIQICVQKVLYKFNYNLMPLEELIETGYVAQVILLYYQIAMTYMIENAIGNGSLTTFQNKLKMFIEKVKAFQTTSSREILLIENLLVDLDVTQDCLAELIAKKVKSIDSVFWKTKFRHYWCNENVIIQIYNVNIHYGYEYLSLTKPFVRTEKVKALFVQLAVFQHHRFACLLQGPSATGKNKAIKEFSRMLGRCCISFNCLDKTSLDQLECLITGVLLSGATLCLNEFNRLSKPVMTIVINHLIGIYQALAESTNPFYKLNGLELNLNSQTAFFLSMNPRYVNRSTLPTNTTAVVRVINIDTADLEAIAHKHFLLAKFETPKKCASLLTSTFYQCSSVVSPMRHYDFQLRAVLATVQNAVWLKSTEKSITEQDATMKVTQMKLRTVSKFPAIFELQGHRTKSLLPRTSVKKCVRGYTTTVRYDPAMKVSENFEDDSRIFAKILLMSKFKPMITTAETAYKTAIVEICERIGLVPTDKFVNMTYNFYYLCRQHCVLILVGGTLSAKSSCLKVAKILTQEKDKVHCNISSIFPSIHTNKEFFGQTDSQKLKGYRRILARAFSNNIGKNEEFWIHIDGVIDSIWDETLKNLLNDNKKLDIGNGKTILFSAQFKLIFETFDLKNVALSTISQCRVLYFDEQLVDPYVLGFKMLPNILEAVKTLQSLSLTNKKLILFRILEVYRLHEAFPQSDVRLAYLLTAIGVLTVLPQSQVIEWLELNQALIPNLNFQNLFNLFPQESGQWLDLSMESDFVIRFWQMFLKRLLRSSMMLTIFGKSGTGKTHFIHSLVSTLNKDNWSVHMLSLSESTTAESLLQAILGCNLIQTRTNHFTGPNAKNLLIVLNGLNRLRLNDSFDSAFEMLRSFHASGKVTDKDGLELEFTSVYFLAEFSTAEVNPLKLQLPERLLKYIYPWHWKNSANYSNPENTCNVFLALANDNNENSASFRDCLISELYTAAGNICDITPFHTYWDNISNLNATLFSHVSDRFISNFNTTGWSISKLPDIRQKLVQHLEKESPQCPQLSTFPTHQYAIRHWMFLHKLLQMPLNGHCLGIGSPLNQVTDIFKLASTLFNLHIEDLSVELSHIQWREVLMKVVRLCVLEERKVLLYVTDTIFNKDVFKEVLIDLIVIINSGSLPPSLFSTQLLMEFREKKHTFNNDNSNTAFQNDMSEWHQKEIIEAAIRIHLHVVFYVERVTVAKFKSQFAQLANYALLVDFDCWSERELMDFTKFKLEKSRLFLDKHQEELGNALMKAFKFSALTNGKHLNLQQFLIFVKEYVHLVEQKKISLELLEKRYKTGVSTLVKANEQIGSLKQELLKLQPELVKTSLETTALMYSLERETIKIENAREVVAANEFKANEAATKAQTLKAECEHEVTDAIPALENAIEALQTLNQTDISTLKTMRFPPQGVRLCMEAVCILLGEKPVKSVNQTGNTTIDYWPTSQKVLSDIHFLTRIQTFPRDRVEFKTMKLIRNVYLSKPEFDPGVMKQVSLAAEGLCLWVKALDVYNKIAKVVAPKKEKLKKAELMVKQHLKQLDCRRKALQEVTEQLQKLSDQFSHMSQRKQELQNQIQNCETKMTRAEKLTSSLETKRKQCYENLKHLKVESGIYKQHALLVAAYIYLLSDFEINEKQKLIPTLQKYLDWSPEVPFNLRSMLQHNSILFNPLSSSLDDDPYIILVLTSQTPLIIDPQRESLQMLQRLIPQTIVTTNMHSDNLLIDIASIIGNGHTLVVDNLCEPLPLCLMQLICPKFTIDSQQTLIQIESRLFPYNPHSRLILRTEKSVSSFSKQILQHLCVIKVAAGEHIVRNKLMNIFVQVNALPLTQKMDQLLTEKTNLVQQTNVIEEQILDKLVKGKELDDDQCGDMLVEVQGLEEIIRKKDAESEVIRAQLDELKIKFIEIGEYGTKLVDASLNVSKLSSFYKRTLKFYLRIFQMTVTMPSETMNQDSAIAEIKKNMLKMFQFKVSRSLFAEHRKIFEFLVSGVIPLKEIPTTSESTFTKYFTNIHSEQIINLRDQILHADLTMPIVLLLSTQSDYVIKTLFFFANTTESTTSPGSAGYGRRQSVQLVSSQNFLKSDWVQILESDQWLIILNCETLDAEKLDAMNQLTKTILANRKSTLRLFFIVYPDKELASHTLFDSSTVITVDDLKLPFTAFIGYSYSSLRPSRIHSTLQTSLLRKQLYKLCCFHFVVFQRIQFGIFGFANSFNVTFNNLECSVKLFESIMLSTPKLTFDAIWRSVIDIAYSLNDPIDRRVLQVLGKWIFEGVNRFDDHTLDKIWPRDFNQSLEKFKINLSEMKIINDKTLSGLGKCVLDEWQKIEVRKTRQNIIWLLTKSEVSTQEATLLPTEMLITQAVSPSDGKVSIDQCLCHELQFLEENGIFSERHAYIKNLLKNPPIREIALYFVERPEAIIETLKFSYARSLRTELDEIETIGIVQSAISDDVIKLVDVYLLGAGLKPGTNILVDSNHAFSSIEGLQIVARRKPARSPIVILIPLLYRSKLNPTTWRHIVNVEVESQLPESHWLLRGVKFITCENCVKFLTAK